MWSVVGRGRSRAGRGTGPVRGDRARIGSGHHLTTDGGGIALAVTPTGANRHDVTRFMWLLNVAPPVRGRAGRGLAGTFPVWRGTSDVTERATEIPEEPRAANSSPRKPEQIRWCHFTGYLLADLERAPVVRRPGGDLVAGPGGSGSAADVGETANAEVTAMSEPWLGLSGRMGLPSVDPTALPPLPPQPLLRALGRARWPARLRCRSRTSRNRWRAISADIPANWWSS